MLFSRRRARARGGGRVFFCRFGAVVFSFVVAVVAAGGLINIFDDAML